VRRRAGAARDLCLVMCGSRGWSRVRQQGLESGEAAGKGQHPAASLRSIRRRVTVLAVRERRRDSLKP